MSEESESISSSTSTRGPTFNSRNVLMREGIMPSTSSTSSMSSRPRASIRRSASDIESWEEQFLIKDEWISLGDGWYQITPVGSGSTEKYGLHSIIESFSGRLFIALYEAKTKECLQACVSSNPSYNLEVHGKIVQIHRNALKPVAYNFQIVFGFKSIYDYYLLTCELYQKRWILSRVKEGEETIVVEAIDLNIKPNIFYEILLQARDNSLSIDINGLAIFTSIRFSDGMNLNGLIGVQAKTTKFAIKGWKLRAIESAIPLAAPVIPVAPTSSSSSVASTSQGRGPRSLADILKDKLGDSSKSTANAFDDGSSVGSSIGSFQRISSEPLVAWGQTGGPGRPQPLSLDPKLSTALSKSMAPPYSHSRRLSVGQYLNKSLSESNGKVNPATKGPIDGASVSSKRLSGRPMNDDAINGQGPIDTRQTDSPADQDQKLTDGMRILYGHHDKSVVDCVFRDVVQKNMGISFNDIAALDTAKRLLNEAVILPLVMPEFFTGIREPWRGVLLFGPPGTGKTLLAKAVCSFSGSTFFNCSASSLISKYRGESEKIVRCLFEAARLCSPSIVFLDEVDALVSSRGGDSEHEASRRMKTEIFSQMDGIASHGRYNISGTMPGSDSSDSQVAGQGIMVLATTNCPWDLDEALRRRLEKRIYIPLPDADAREEIFRICLKNIPVFDDIENIKGSLAASTEGYSGADIHILCREASMMPIRRLMVDMSPQEIQQKRFLGILEVPTVLYEDFIAAIENTRPSVSPASISKFLSWDREFGSR